MLLSPRHKFKKEGTKKIAILFHRELYLCSSIFCFCITIPLLSPGHAVVILRCVGGPGSFCISYILG